MLEVPEEKFLVRSNLIVCLRFLSCEHTWLMRLKTKVKVKQIQSQGWSNKFKNRVFHEDFGRKVLNHETLLNIIRRNQNY